MPRIGRPTVLTPALKTRIAELFWLAFTDAQVAFMCDINVRTIERIRAGGFCREIKRAELEREAKYRKRIWDSKVIPAGICWMLERKYPTQFAKPEIQLSFNNSYTQNNLSISIDVKETKQIEAQALPIRSKIEDMFKAYRPQLPHTNGDDTSSHKSDDASS